MPAAEYICGCGAAADTAADDYAADTEARAMTTIHVETPDKLLTVPEASYPTGSVARLYAPMQVDRGLWVEPRLVNSFEKKSNGRWLSYPGGDISYPTLSALALAAPVESVFTPAQDGDGADYYADAGQFGTDYADMFAGIPGYDPAAMPRRRRHATPPAPYPVPPGYDDGAPEPSPTTTATEPAPSAKNGAGPRLLIAGAAVVIGAFLLFGRNKRRRR